MGSNPHCYKEFDERKIEETEKLIGAVLHSLHIFTGLRFSRPTIQFLTAIYLKFKDKTLSSRDLRFNTYSSDLLRSKIISHLKNAGLLLASRDSYKLSPLFLDTLSKVEDYLKKVGDSYKK